MKFSIMDFFSRCDQIHRKLRIWSHLLKKYLIENFIFWAVRKQILNGISITLSLIFKDIWNKFLLSNEAALVYITRINKVRHMQHKTIIWVLNSKQPVLSNLCLLFWLNYTYIDVNYFRKTLHLRCLIRSINLLT